MFFSETSTAKRIETVPYLTNLYARELASQLDVLYQPEARPPSTLTNDLDYGNIYLMDSTTPLLFHPSCIHLLPRLWSCHRPQRRNHRRLFFRRGFLFPGIDYSSSNLLYWMPILLPQWRCCRQHVNVASVDSPTLRPRSTLINIQDYDERDLVIRRRTTTSVFCAFTQTCKPWRVGRDHDRLFTPRRT
jgi:hypothetical protein